MLTIYTTRSNALVADSDRKIYWYAGNQEARMIARAFKHSLRFVENLAVRSEFLQTVGYKEVKLGFKKE